MKNLFSYVSIFAYVAFFYLLSPSPSSFASSAKNSLYTKHKKDLEKIELYLNSIKNLSAKFIQKTSDGNITEGNFFLSRPGKMRIEYSAEPQIVIIVNGPILSYYDVELEEVSHLRTNTTPASLLTRKNISFNSKDIEVTGVENLDSEIKVSLIKKNRKEAGEFSLTFSTEPLKFIKMEVKNDLDQIISVSLLTTDFKSKISNKLFVIRKPTD